MSVKNIKAYPKPIYILAFDHRSSFKKIAQVEDEMSLDEKNKIIELKNTIYQGFKKTLNNIPKESAALLVDSEFGEDILKEAKKQGYTFCMPVEKSGQKEFVFEYGDQFPKHIEKYKPSIVKVLVRYNPEEDKEMNNRQKKRLAKLSQHLKENGYPFLFELLVQATDEQLKKVGGKPDLYDLNIRPKLTRQTVAELQAGEVEPDIWKIEGMEKIEHYQALIKQIKSGGRSMVDTIVLGRGADKNKVEHWLETGAKTEGIIGFAVGRTIFLDTLKELMAEKISKEKAIEEISQSYIHFYNIFKKNNK